MMKRHPILILAAGFMAACGSAAATAPDDETGNTVHFDTTDPWPIDRGGADATAPTSYKGLPLLLTDNGTPSISPVDGLIGLVCIGMSNGVRECDDFQRRSVTSLSTEINPQVRVVNCAVGGNAIERWIDPDFDRDLWDACIQQKIPAAGLRPDQVRVIWHKAADQFNTLPGNVAKPQYPSPSSDYYEFFDHLTRFAARVHGEFPSVQAVYTSSRSYGGYAGNQAERGEPLSYEEGHALNTWLATNRVVDGVWYGWGPYLWAPACAAGVTNAGGVCYDRADFVNDGVHPSEAGQAKVSGLLHARFMREAWYRR